MREVALAFVVMIVIIAAFFGVAIALDSAGCKARFEGSEIQSRYSVLGGCRVHDPKFGWIPADNFRSLGEE